MGWWAKLFAWGKSNSEIRFQKSNEMSSRNERGENRKKLVGQYQMAYLFGRFDKCKIYARKKTGLKKMKKSFEKIKTSRKYVRLRKRLNH